MDCSYGFRIVGPTWARRRLVSAAVAFAGYAACDKRAELRREAYLSAFDYTAEFRRHLETTGSTRNYTGPCGGRYVWMDIDLPDDLEAARRGTVALYHACEERYGVRGNEVLAFFSGSKGFHLGLATALWAPAPCPVFHRAARHFASRLATIADVPIDTSIYDKVRAFRAPNSRHPRSGLHKVQLDIDEMRRLPVRSIQRRAKQPRPFAVPSLLRRETQAHEDWQQSLQSIEQPRPVRSSQPSGCVDGLAVNRLTLELIRDGSSVPVGERHRRLFSAAANLAEFGCPPELAHALLSEAGLDSGLPPKEVRRQIDCGLAHRGGPPHA
jgi:hypothetical protein